MPIALGKAGTKFADLNIFVFKPYLAVGRAYHNQRNLILNLNYLKIKGEKSNGY